MIRFGGRAVDAVGDPMTGVAGVSFAIYAEQTGGAPLWQETQNVATDANGRFSALLGATSPTGIPIELFSSGESLWLAVLPHSPGVSEQPRVLLVSVPFALRAADSDMLGGNPASAYMLSNSQGTIQGGCAEPGTLSPVVAASPLIAERAAVPAIAVSGANGGVLPMFTDTAGDLSNSVIAQSGNKVGIGTTAPGSPLQVVGTGIGVIALGESSNGNGKQLVLGVNPSGNGYGTIQSVYENVAFTPLVMNPYGGNVGIGTTTPGSPFQVVGTGIGVIALGESSNSSGKQLVLGVNTSGNGYGTIQSVHENVAFTPLLMNPYGGNVGIGTTAPDQMLTVNGSIHSTAGGFVFPDGSRMTTATLPGLLQGGNLILGAGAGTLGVGNLELQTAGDVTNTMSDRLVIVGTPKAMTGALPMANLFSMHILAGDAAGGTVKFTIVASDGVHYAMETGELIYLASPNQITCGVVYSKYAVAPPLFTNTVLAVPGIGQPGSLDAQCNYTTFGGDPGLQIFDTAPTSFTPTTHKVYYTIENQSQAVITLQP